jgi:CBS domain-containing protein
MQAQDVMVRGVISVGPDIPVQIAANAMVSNCVSALPVINLTRSWSASFRGRLIWRVGDRYRTAPFRRGRNTRVKRRAGEGVRQVARQTG